MSDWQGFEPGAFAGGGGGGVQNPLTGDLAAGGHKITGLAVGVSDTDAANVGQIPVTFPAASITGTLGTANGGTGDTAYTSGAVALTSSTPASVGPTWSHRGLLDVFQDGGAAVSIGFNPTGISIAGGSFTAFPTGGFSITGSGPYQLVYTPGTVSAGTKFQWQGRVE